MLYLVVVQFVLFVFRVLRYRYDALQKLSFPLKDLSRKADHPEDTWTVLNPLVASFLKAEWMYIPIKDSSFGMIFPPTQKLRKPTGLLTKHMGMVSHWGLELSLCRHVPSKNEKLRAW